MAAVGERPGRIIRIRHGLLPAFAGSRPCERACERGRDLERRVLPNAVHAHLQRRFIIHNNRTIIFHPWREAGVRNVAIYVYDDVEVMDFCGPFEVFSAANELNGWQLLQVHTVSLDGGPVRARNGLVVQPLAAAADAPAPDVLVVPGGDGSRAQMRSEAAIEWVRRAAAGAELVLSVCTGALILGRAGLLEGLTATTHRSALRLLADVAANTRVEAAARFVDNGRILTSGGISAGIDLSLHAVRRLYGDACARRVAGYMEYEGGGGEHPVRPSWL